MGKPGEFEIIAGLVGGLSEARDGVVCGIGDDTAVLKCKAGRELLATCDSQIEGVHFVSGSLTPEQLGRRIAAVNLSDIAAMGGVPTYALMALCVPADTSMDFLRGVYRGLDEALVAEGARLIGGNTARLPERMVFDLTLLGEVECGLSMLRSGAGPGERVWVSGRLGGAAAGLELLTSAVELRREGTYRELVHRHLQPTARCRTGVLLGRCGHVTACIDISDGLLADAGHLAELSGVNLVIDLESLPLMDGVDAFCVDTGYESRLFAATSGEEYELLFTATEAFGQEQARAVERETGVPVTCIGRVAEGDGCVFVERDDRLESVERAGFDHFKD